ncbi:MAG: arginine--tRNA ligase [Planctomycetota bacterium]
MKPAIATLDERISAAMAAVAGRSDCEAQVCPATDPKFGDYQANGVMPLAKRIKTDPRKLAEKVVKNLDVSDICEPPEVAGPGFINLRLKADFVADRLLEINADNENRLGIERNTKTETIVVDFSGPNIAKQMHVGHLRSTIIGDCICRLLEFLGHKIIRQNHIGDWGVPMGMVVYALEDVYWEQDAPKLNLEILQREYKRIVELEKEDTEVASKVRKRTAELQDKEPLAMRYWREACGITMRECYDLYDVLGVMLRVGDTRGESFYEAMLPDVVNDLKRAKLAEQSKGAICVFPKGFKNKEGQRLPFIIQKSDGAYLYATTDLAALRWRIGALKADKIIYVTDARQSLHFQMLFAVADDMAGWTKRNDYKTQLIHVTFGSVLGENGKPLKTREGENVKLKDLLDGAVERARAVVEEKNPDLPPDRKDEIAGAVGIGAVKYADFSNNRTSDYIFSFDKMLAMDGNTAPYMQYAYARVKSIERKGKERGVDVEAERSKVEKANLTEPSELDLAKHLVRYVEAIQAAAADYRPNYLTSYLYELAQKFSVFYTNCPVLDAGLDKRPTRLLLCRLTAKTIRHGLSELLGIEVVEQM